ncbi:rhamnolipids biosynthesis 3-oxoacyl-reductase [Rickenella mellea]|uniref:Rhamnolipids biosynthesis 3-oxoacyl-reductase n=1 Tax=Rickenella mellea TaxID=50990 RepID=A0A4Y7PTT3_9AGAM|nr:rhamnolipids biosynthesis 3-oxoacyl-reductase [Rickenella mellea]
MSQELSIPNLFHVKSKIAVVSGGGSGIGKMIASALVANGAKVYIAARKESQLKAAADELNASGPGKCHYIVADLGSKAGCDALVAEIKKRESKIHILVNNSGATWGASWDNFPEKEGWDRVLALNVKSIFYMTSGLSDLLEKDSTSQDPARVINISSVAGVSAHAEGSSVADAGMGLWSYNTSKAAVNHLTSTLAVTLAKRYVTVNAILPGVFPSKMTAFGFKTTGEKKMAEGQPMGRVGSTRDMAGIALFLCSPASAHITGQHIMIDGGATLFGGKVSPGARL